MVSIVPEFCFFFFNDTATTEIYTLSLHDALPISVLIVLESSWICLSHSFMCLAWSGVAPPALSSASYCSLRSEEHTSELQSQSNLVCRLLLEKKKKHHQSSSPSMTFLPCRTTIPF